MAQPTLDQALRDAHNRDDTAALIDLYTRAGDQAELCDDIDAACFYLTHAFVYALETGAPVAAALNTRLAEKGRAHPFTF